MFAMAYMGRKRRATRISCYAALTNDHVCGPGWPGPHEVHQRHQTRQEIRAKPTIAFVISTGRMLQRQEKQSKHIVFGPGTLWRTWRTRPVPSGLVQCCQLLPHYSRRLRSAYSSKTKVHPQLLTRARGQFREFLASYKRTAQGQPLR